MSPQRKTPQPLRTFPWRFVASALLAALLLATAGPALTDDRELLRTQTAKPYVFILLDTSASMAMKIGEEQAMAPGGADGPDSRLYQAKQALYNVFKDVQDVQFGFASYKQDAVYAQAKHWLYYHTDTPPDGWPITFPAPEPRVDPDLSHPNLAEFQDAEADGSLLTQVVRIPEVDEEGNPLPTVDEDGNPLPLPDPDTRVGEVSGDLLTFGPSFVVEGAVQREAGTCADPLDLDDTTDRQRAQTFAIDGLESVTGEGTRLWLEEGNTTYLLEIDRPGTVTVGDDDLLNPAIGEDNMVVHMEAYEVSNCSGFDPDVETPERWTLKLELDPFLNQTFFVDGEIGDGSRDNTEETPGLWDYQDIFSTADHTSSSPFEGSGWEVNYDSEGVVTPDSDFNDLIAATYPTPTDRKCFPDSNTNNCSHVKPVSDTIVSSLGRAMDKGDLLPFDWGPSQRDELLERLAPNHPSGSPDFRVASYFEDDLAGGDFLALLNTAVRPLPAQDLSPFAGILTDLRCWYLGQGSQQGNRARKCEGTPFFDQGWEEIACANDSEFGCRRPYFIYVGDGEQSGGGSSQDATASLSDLDNDNTKIWAVNLGPERNCNSGGGIHPIIQTSKGECLTVSTGSQLRQTLQQILGLIRTEARSFASAAVPTVQAAVEQKIFLTNFTPLNDSGVWDGHLLSFLKPLPTEDGRPNTDILCSDLADEDDEQAPSQCFLWDAGETLKTLQYDGDSSDGFAPLSETDGNLRRVYYARRATAPGEWAENRRLFETQALQGSNQERRFDLYRGMGLSFDEDEDDGDGIDSTVSAVNQLTNDTANEVITYTLSIKDGTLITTDEDNNEVDVPITFLLGDTFHSTPQVVGTPANPFYFASDLYGDDSLDCKVDDTDASANKGYRCFFERQRFRRKMLIVGANDGQLHVFDAGRFRTSGNDHFTDVELQDDDADTPGNDFGSFDNGTGKELFSYIPRMVLPTLREQEDAPSSHRFSVDGDVVVADVFIDPNDDTAVFPDPDDRLWRTVAIGGLREGGRGYYALDITQPDPVETHSDLGFIPSVSGDNDPATGDYLPACVQGGSDCGPTDFPSVVWEFTDSVWDATDEAWYLADEDVDVLGNGACNGSPPDPSCGVHDLGDTWSTPNVGRVRVCRAGGTACNPVVGLDDTVDDDLIDVFVAVFAGGMDVESKTAPESETRGNWLYMVDVETGQPIYKQRLTGAAPADVAAVDTNNDRYLDRIYIGTLAGLMYRVDLAPLSNGELPALEDVDFNAFHSDPSIGTSKTFTQSRLPRSVWQPVVLFDADYDGANPLPDGVHRSIYHRPSVIFRAGAANFALAFGTGDREDLWTTRDTRERFYVFVDSFDTVDDIVTELREGDFRQIDPAVDAVAQDTNFLLTDGGWYFNLGDDERVITESFAISGLTIFSSFIPEVIDDETGTEINIGCGDLGGPGNNDDSFAVSCSKQGNSNNYVVETTSGDGLLFEGDDQLRYDTVGNFVTNPFTEQSQTKRSKREGAGDSADDLSENMLKVMEALKDLFPPQCKFGNYRLDVKTIAADTSVQMIAPVPVCIIQTNWKEF